MTPTNQVGLVVESDCRADDSSVGAEIAHSTDRTQDGQRDPPLGPSSAAVKSASGNGP